MGVQSVGPAVVLIVYDSHETAGLKVGGLVVVLDQKPAVVRDVVVLAK